MRPTAGVGLLLGCLIVAWGRGVAGEEGLRSDLAGFRSWKKLTREPQIVPYELSALCAPALPTPENIERHGPHTNRWIMVYANPLAAAAVRDDSAPRFPPGAIIAKEKLRHPAAAHVDGVAFMVKHSAGEFTASGGWEFLYHPSSSGQPSYDTCVSCHRTGGRKDFVFGTYAPPVRRREQPASDASALVGVWHLVTGAGGDQDTDLEILPDGRMIYAIHEADKWQLMKLTYRVEGHVIVSNQPSAPHEERTHYSLQTDGRLVLELGGERTVFRRGARRVPFHEQ